MKKEITLADKLDAAEAVIDAYVKRIDWMAPNVADLLAWITDLRKTVQRLDEGGTE